MLTYGSLDSRVEAAARGISILGFGVGARVAPYLPKDAPYLVLLLALIPAG